MRVYELAVFLECFALHTVRGPAPATSLHELIHHGSSPWAADGSQRKDNSVTATRKVLGY